MKFRALLLSGIAACLSVSCLAQAERSFDGTVEQKVDAVVSIFENGTPELQYDYVEALPDGRGYTAGPFGFTTATGDLLEVVQRYQSKGPATSIWPQLQSLMPILESRASSESGDIKGLEALPQVWQESANDQKFLDAQDEISDELYREPAKRYCKNLGLNSALSYLVLYDSIIQHGEATSNDDDYFDSLPALLARTPANSDEHAFINSFLKVRRADLLNPKNSRTATEWRESVGRVDALQKLVDQGKWDLASPLRIEVWNKTYAL